MIGTPQPPPGLHQTVFHHGGASDRSDAFVPLITDQCRSSPAISAKLSVSGTRTDTDLVRCLSLSQVGPLSEDGLIQETPPTSAEAARAGVPTEGAALIQIWLAIARGINCSIVP